MPLAAGCIVCLGLIPLLGAPAQPLHWAATGGMIGFGVLLWARRRLRGTEAALLPVSQPAAEAASRAVFLVVALVSVLVTVIVGYRLRDGGSMSALSLSLPVLGLAWLALLAFQLKRHREPAATATNDDRPSRRPPEWDSVPRANRKSNHPAPPGQVNA